MLLLKMVRRSPVMRMLTYITDAAAQRDLRSTCGHCCSMLRSVQRFQTFLALYLGNAAITSKENAQMEHVCLSGVENTASVGD